MTDIKTRMKIWVAIVICLVVVLLVRFTFFDRPTELNSSSPLPSVPSLIPPASISSTPASTPTPTPKPAKAKTVTALDEPCESALLKVTATDIKTILHPVRPDALVIGVHFVVENVGEDSFYLSGKDIAAYADDVSVNESSYAYKFKDTQASLFGDLVPGKRSQGYYCIDIPKEAQTIEIHFQDLYGDSIAIFRLPVPPVEDVDSE